MAQHTFETTADQEAALIGIASAKGCTVNELIASQVLERFLPEVESQWMQVKRDRLADTYEAAPDVEKAKIDAVVEKVQADLEQAKAAEAQAQATAAAEEAVTP